MDSILTSVAAHIEGFTEIAEAVRPGIKLSEQAISVLSQLNQSKGSKFLELKMMGGTKFMILDGNQGGIVIDESRFIEDDLCNLCELGFLRLNCNSKGDRLFHLTRQAANYISVITR